jgi:hypothetical protein
MPVTDPIFCPLLTTIITPNNLVRHAIRDMIKWRDRDVISDTYTLLTYTASTRLASFMMYKLTHVLYTNSFGT